MDNGAQSSLNLRAKLLCELNDQEYRRGFVEGHATDTIAFQLRALRKARDLDQREVGERLGNPKLQPMISRYENPDYGRYSIKTLLELAAAFDVALIVRFAPYSELVEWDFASSPAQLAPPAFADDKRLAEITAEVHCAIDEQATYQQACAGLAQVLQLGSAGKATKGHGDRNIPIGNYLRSKEKEPLVAVGQ
jgi:transcriptional regulator with XRE-family HTH domain